MSWNDERVEQLKALWGQGSSASQIAKILGGVTRNAVIGKAHRLGLSGSAKPAQPRPEPRREPHEASTRSSHGAGSTERATPRLVIPASPPPPPIEELEVPPEHERVSLLKLNEKMCKWPIGNPGDATFRFCGHQAHPGLPYCASHGARAYQPVSKKERDRDRLRTQKFA
jgi:GcrA cell cycle regulator